MTTTSTAKTEKEPSPSSLPSVRGIDFVLVTALAEERDAVLEKLPGYRQLPPSEDDIRTYFQAELSATFPDGSTGSYNIIVMPLLGMGRVEATIATADAIHRWHPRYILLVGIAGGLAINKIALGDLLISDQIVDYELQKITSQDPQIRWEVQRADPRLLNACNNFLGDSWLEEIRGVRPDLGKPRRHTGPIASGDKVVAFGEILEKYQNVWPKLIGVEMEAAGVATAVFQASKRPGFFMVRGVSDLADENKGTVEVKKWRSYAGNAAASFAVALIKSGPIPLQETVKSVSRRTWLLGTLMVGVILFMVLIFLVMPKPDLLKPPRVEYLRKGQTGDLKELQEGGTLYPGDLYRIQVVPALSGYMYILHVNEEGADCLFPRDMKGGVRYNAATNPVESGKSYLIPNAEGAFEIDQVTNGLQKIYVFVGNKRDSLEAHCFSDKAKIPAQGESNPEQKDFKRSLDQSGLLPPKPAFYFYHLPLKE